jgi:hypothetical protein
MARERLFPHAAPGPGAALNLCVSACRKLAAIIGDLTHHQLVPSMAAVGGRPARFACRRTSGS